MKIKNVRPWPVDVPAAGVEVDAGGTVDVPADVADLLLAQPANWREVAPPKSDKKKGDV